MLFSVIIPTFKRRELLRSCLNQLAPKAQVISPDLYEVIVTDDALEGAHRESLENEFPWIRLLAGPQKGPASNRNNGARAANGQWLVFVDDDCLPEPTFLAAYQEAIRLHAEYRVFEGCILPERPQHRLDEEAPINHNGGFLWSCNFMIERKLFFELGGFCELYPYAGMEDVDFCEQLKERKIDFLFLPKASVVHPWRPIGPEDTFLKRHLISHAIFYRRYPMQKPSFYLAFRIVARIWIFGLFVEAPRFGFRGGKRYFERQWTLTQFYIQIGPYLRALGAEGSRQSPISAPSRDV